MISQYPKGELTSYSTSTGALEMKQNADLSWWIWFILFYELLQVVLVNELLQRILDNASICVHKKC